MTGERGVERVAQLVAVVASVWFALVAVWEIAGPFGAGHVASSTALGIAGENMWQWGIVAPVTHYSLTEPLPSEYYCHHPWGIFWTTALLTQLFGHHDFVCRLPPALMSAATVPLLYAIGRALWSPVAGALCAASFAVLPIALAFANFNALEVPVIFGVLLATWGLVRFAQSGRRRWALVSLAGLVHALNSDWPAFVFAAVVLLLAIARVGCLNGRWYPRLERRPALLLWCCGVAACAGVVLFYHHQLSAAGQLESLTGSAEVRSAGWSAPLSEVLARRAHWIRTCFTPLAIALGVLALPVLIFRVIALRRDLEVLPLAVLVMATVQYVAFPQGADVHIFWPHYFAAYFALGVGALGASVEGLVRALPVHRTISRSRALPGVVALVLALPVVLAILPDGVRGLRYARRTGGRFDEKGLIIHQDLDKTALMKWLAAGLDPQTPVGIHRSMKYSWSLEWSLGRPAPEEFAVPLVPADGPDRHVALDSRYLSGAALDALSGIFSVQAVGPFWVIDRAAPHSPLVAHAFERREPVWWEWALLQAHDPILGIAADPYHTWELRHHFAQTPNPVPTSEPRTGEQLRIAHNLAVAQGDGPRAIELHARLVDTLDRLLARPLAEGIELLGTRFDRGVAPRLTVYFRASGPTPFARDFVILSEVLAAPAWSLVPADPKPREVGMPFPLPTDHWQAGFLYACTSEIRSRPGSERFYGYLQGSPEPAPAAVELLRLP